MTTIGQQYFGISTIAIFEHRDDGRLLLRIDDRYGVHSEWVVERGYEEKASRECLSIHVRWSMGHTRRN